MKPEELATSAVSLSHKAGFPVYPSQKEYGSRSGRMAFSRAALAEWHVDSDIIFATRFCGNWKRVNRST
jgi:hypothetical protein